MLFANLLAQRATDGQPLEVINETRPELGRLTPAFGELPSPALILPRGSSAGG
jgi:hypothetical protein